jgi:alpha-N-arabinofuranosidase
MRTFQNPILSGFHPDPSVCRAGEDYYLVNSTFEFFPGVPIFHSRDLVNWRQIGHVLDRPEQLPLDGMRPSGGIYAPTIRYHDRTFYMITTNVGGGGNFYVTATDPAGDWSDTVWLPDAPGIDPSLLFDDDGKCYYTGHRRKADAQYPGDCEIWVQELDVTKGAFVGEPVGVWDGHAKRSEWAEGPHLYKINGAYYLLIAEGGTGISHAVTVARSESPFGPFEGYMRNPILTHRHLRRTHEISCTGHSDLIETQTGEWWLVFLGCRPVDGEFFPLGRETFLAPVEWEDDWPHVNPDHGRARLVERAPDLEEHSWTEPPTCDNFETPELADCWNLLRTPHDEWWSLTDRPGFLRLLLRPESVCAWENPSFVGRRITDKSYQAEAALEFGPAADNETAGIVLLQNDGYHIRFEVTLGSNGPAARVTRREDGADALQGEVVAPAGRVYLRVEARGLDYRFAVADTPGNWTTVADDVDGRVLASNVAGGFIGSYIGMYASANGQPSESVADFDWFGYQGIDR